MRNRFLSTLLNCAEQDERIFLISIDLGYSVLEPFFERFPKRYLNVGVQEQNAVSVAAGLAKTGRIVYVYSIVPFATMRCYEQIRIDLAYYHVPVRLVGVGAGYAYGALGSTHHAIEDVALMRSLPNMTVLCPGDPEETEALTRLSVDLPGPAYLRLGKGKDPKVHESVPPLVLGHPFELAKGKDLTICASSSLLPVAKEVHARLSAQGIAAGLYSFPTLKPLNGDAVREILRSSGHLVSLEEHSIIGGLGSALAEILAESDARPRFKRFGIPDLFTHTVGSQDFLRRHLGLDAESLTSSIGSFLSDQP